MNKFIACTISFISICAQAEKIGVYPLDCGPLARGEYGTVFRVERFPKGQTYFSKGRANELCPRLLSGKLISGYEKRLPENYLFSESEQTVIKEFVIVADGEK
ncbi:hypothetical protein [Cellvibrio sp. PSBB006]|uniref:hypothetical protein n=1 Tax=Cellvibrio sp. PSBB006 TaxID=1987723 RepID=UPI000B3B8F40|nr:hypothetical protein [Cellvibrio sp. PSBB006]ARU28171.1 hypothetical protein CBR65_12460 [Cellvibrio sp. PSBB006]